MNFGKNQTLKKKTDLATSAPMFGRKAGFSFLKALFLALIASGVICICLVAGVVKGLIDSAPNINDVNIMPSGYATLVYDANGNQLQRLSSSSSNRTSVSIDKIPEDMQHAIVAIEDERFYEHNGIDVRGILRAFVKGVTNGFNFDEGASTLTQQLLKNNVFTNWTNEGKIERFKRKFQEQYLALQLEASLTAQGKNTKDVIMENYLNTINFGAGTYGVQAASMRYFSKNVNELTLSECCVLAAIPQNPTRYNPINHPDENAQRRERVLQNMLDQGYITQTEYDEALTDNVYERIQESEAALPEEAPYSYFIDELIEQVIEDLQIQKGYTEVQARNALYSGGLRIYTTQDPVIQEICDEEYADPDNFPADSQIGIDWALSVEKANGKTQHYSVEMMRLYFQNTDPDFELLFDSEEEAQSYIDAYKASVVLPGESIIAERTSFSPQPQSSLTVMDQRTGYVKAIVGGRGEKTASLTLNRATNTYRQPGSTFKILSTYAPALDKGMTLATTFVDAPYEYSDGTRVRNWLNDSYNGPTTIRYAIEQSINVVAVKCLTEITPQAGFDYLKKFGFSNLVESETINGQIFSDIHQPLALGGITYGVSNLELTAAYAALANGGTYIKPMFYTRILDAEGNVVLENTPQTTTVTKESTAYLLTSAMEDVVSEGTGTNLQLDDMTVAGKTGTTSAYNDVWFAGYTPYYTCAVWAGYDNNENLSPEGIGRSYHQILWRKIMNRIHENLPDVDFQMPDSVTEATVCEISGKLASSGCPTVTEYFEKATLPTERCTSHRGYSDYDDSENSSAPSGPGSENFVSSREEDEENENGYDSYDGYDDYDDGSGNW
ncbi:MAG: transglycosylase domain-containing protein [Ruminococcus sp.]|jgi:penicillin-binding protein 1A